MLMQRISVSQKFLDNKAAAMVKIPGLLTLSNRWGQERTGKGFSLPLSDDNESNHSGDNNDNNDALHDFRGINITRYVERSETSVTRLSRKRLQEFHDPANFSFINPVARKTFSHITAKYNLPSSKRASESKKEVFKNASSSLILEMAMRPHKRCPNLSAVSSSAGLQSIIGSRRIDFDSYVFCRYYGLRQAYLSLRRQFGDYAGDGPSRQSELVLLQRLLSSQFPAFIELQEVIKLANEDTLCIGDATGYLPVLAELLDHSQSTIFQPRKGNFIPGVTRKIPLREYSPKVCYYKYS